jgi:hypothetical protein
VDIAVTALISDLRGDALVINGPAGDNVNALNRLKSTKLVSLDINNARNYSYLIYIRKLINPGSS